ncbi:wybutosine biosynthesis protein Tyw1 [Schizosaccharomyces octosporus yFS286]|uniref:S-adenosyl-L-methionine-dependent tRNA 4-demethylwyosine synthase n=1 Tax=Schizosaccharomyces octosporus (strain yFS286) TaxID=483514 RepID=S9R0J7_SCHOY|nr:wybutosine biosynthesis protein Tyw1 [Schizosaccharomyces octosporus yFS286]EPX71990.1 wybutosine biosynthesis protein Tyw1 [Schizosaccharomyces octosporus yFS286]
MSFDLAYLEEKWGTYRGLLFYLVLLLPVAAHVLLSRNKKQLAVSSEENLPKEKENTKHKKTVKRFTRKNVKSKLVQSNSQNEIDLLNSPICIFYATLGGTAQRYANEVHKLMSTNLQRDDLQLLSLDYIDLEEYFLSCPENAVYLIILPSYAIESSIDFYLSTLRETFYDFRVQKNPLEKLSGYAVFGLGDMDNYPGDMFCYQAIQTDKWLSKLGASRIAPMGVTNSQLAPATQVDVLTQWTNSVLENMKKGTLLRPIDEGEGNSEVMDVEDMGPMMAKAKAESSLPVGTKEMVSTVSPTYKALTKQGYSVVGSHSGVKICRWTKNAMRGRGFCYKYSFYGIRSHLCMEATPSLACANKCTFCWRHGTNPVGTEWRWKVDPPELIMKGVLESHYAKLKLMRGVPGVRQDRFLEASRVRHCALSLVGEPIFYPYINEFVGMLHEREISSFLVTNAQHPEAFRKMGMVTQLYVSIDASTKQSLKSVDRPLFKDFWERLLTCLEILREKKQRTVYRMTLVKGFNMEQIKEYTELIRLGVPCFIEIKGVTYSGNSDQSPLTMKNVPYYEEVVDFTKKLIENIDKYLGDLGVKYEIAAEHAHSCSLLVAQTKFKKNDMWYTHIDYAKFFELWRTKEAFDPMDYIAPTPDFAYFGQGGFSPEDVRFVRKQKNKNKPEATPAPTAVPEVAA